MRRPRRRRRWWVRALVGVGVTLLVLLLVVAGVVAIVLGTPGGTRWALERGVAYYGGRIAGSVSFETTDGALAGELCIRGLRLADGQDHTLLTAEVLCLRPRLGELVSRTVELERLSVEGVVLHVWPDGAWGDLAPPSPEPPPDEPPGPDLPVRITTPLTIDGLEVIRHGEAGSADAGEMVDEDTPFVRGAWLYAELEAEGRRAELVVHSVGGELPVADATLEDGELAVRWQSPMLMLDRLTLVSSYGRVEARAGLDATKGALRYVAGVDASALVPMKEGNPAWRVPLELSLEGNAETATVDARAWAPTLGRVKLSAQAAFSDELRVTSLVDVVPDPLLGFPPVHAWLAMQSPEDQPLRAELTATAPGLLLVAAWDGVRVQARATVDGAQVDASMLVQDGRPRYVEALVAVSSAAHATAAIDRLVPAEVPRVEGSVRLATSCRVADAWSCGLQAAVRQHGDHLETAAKIDVVGDVLELQLQRLSGRLRQEPVRLAAPVHATVTKESVSLTPLRLAIAGGEVAAEGRVSWKGASDLEVRLARLDLGVIPRFVPSVPIGGRLGGRLTARGELGQPTLTASIGAIGLRWQREPLGELFLDAGYDDHRARADVRWHRGDTKVWARADVPLVLDPQGAGVVLRERAPVYASVEVEALSLDELASLVGGPAIGGRVDATVRASGRLRDPVVEAEVTGTDLRFEDGEIGRVLVTASAQDGVVKASLDLHGPALDEAHVDATLPLALRPTRGGVAYDARGRHELSARIEGIDLDQLEPWLGASAPDLDGRVRVQAEASAEAGDVRGRVELLGRDLVAVGYEVGALEATAELGDGQARAQAVVSSSWARYVGLDASIPLALDGPLSAPTLSPQAPISAHVELVDVELAGIGRLGPGPAIGGELEGTLDVGGTLRHPELRSELTIERLYHAGKPLGDVRLRTGYDGEALVAKLEHRYVTAKVDAYGRVPIEVDLAAAKPKVAWHRERTHRLSARVQGIDQDLVALLVDLPEDLRFEVAARVEASGTATDPHAMVQLRGHVRGPNEGGLPTPVSVQVDVEPERQDARVLMGARGPEGLVVEAHATAPLATLLKERSDPSDIEVNVIARAQDFDLRELEPLLPESLHDPRGHLTLRASMQGPLTAPVMAGEIELRDGAITVVPMRQKFEGIQLHATMNGPDFVLDTLRAHSADGTASARASLHLEKGKTRGSAVVTTRQLPLVRPGLPAMRLDLRVEAELDATGEVTEVAVRASDGFLDVLAVSPLAAAEPIPEDADVVYIDAEGLRQQRRKAKRESAEPWLPEDVAFSLALAEPLRVRGPQADMDWNGRFELLRRPNVPPTAQGSFRTEGGRVSMLGDEFDIESATIRFPETGDLDPFIDLVATTDTPEALVTMIIRGRVSRPQLELRSEPPMPESDIFALLITGHANADDADDKEFSAKAAGVLAAFNNAALQRQLREKVGIDRVGVGFGETVDQPIVTVGKRINDKLYVEAGYHHNAPRGVNEAEVRLEYRFAPPRWSVETFFGDAAQGGVGLWWNRRFASRGQRKGLERRESTLSQSQSPPTPAAEPP